ncbi:MAG: hypothetical protein ACRC33_17645 [Gemmataceae bacterium]
MAENRNSRPPVQPAGVPTPAAVEVLRLAAESGAKDGEKESSIPLFWRVFGGTVLSIAALVLMTAYAGFTASLAAAQADVGTLGKDVRKEITRLTEMRAELIEKDDLATRMNSVWRNLDELKDDRAELVKLREACSAVVAAFKAGERHKRQLERELQALREEQAADRERSALVEQLSRLRERLASLEAKAVRADGPDVP